MTFFRILFLLSIIAAVSWSGHATSPSPLTTKPFSPATTNLESQTLTQNASGAIPFFKNLIAPLNKNGSTDSFAKTDHANKEANGGGKTFSDTFSAVAPFSPYNATHRICKKSACVVIQGPGLDQCNINADCRTSHTTCSGNKCIVVPEPGKDECSLLNNEPCPSKDFYLDCRTILGSPQCTRVLGTGPNRCFNDGDCRPTAAPAPPAPGPEPAPGPPPPVPPPSCPASGTSATLANQILTRHYRGSINGFTYNGDGKYTCELNTQDCSDLEYTANGKSLAGVGNCQVDAISPNVLLLILTLIETQGHSIDTFALCSDHPTYTSSGNISRHVLGEAVDISGIDGISLASDSSLSGTLAVDRYINTLIGSCLAPDQLITVGVGGEPRSEVGALEINNGVSAPYFYIQDHTNHIHVGY